MERVFVEKFNGIVEFMRHNLLRKEVCAEISRPELTAMQMIWYLSQEETPATTAKISKGLEVSKSAISQVTNGLEAKGYLIKNYDLGDRRQPVLQLTSQGKEILYHAEEEMSHRLEDIFEHMGQQRATAFLELLDEFVKSARDVLR